MTIEDATFQFLASQPNITAIVPKSRIYRYVVPQNSLYPAITIVRVDTVRDLAQDGSTRVAESRMQLGCFSMLNDAESRRIADEIRMAVDGYRGTWGTVKILRAHIETDIGGYDAISRTFQTMVDCLTMFWEEDP
jgi:Protein of unknown function (DUF3168)